MVRVISGPAAEWLSARRSELNGRFARAQQRVPALSAEAVLAVLAEVLPPLAGPEPSSGDLLSAVYDLVLLHVGRDTLAARPGIDALLRTVFPKIRPLLLERPSVLPGALSNAVENLGARGVAFAQAIGEVLSGVETSDLVPNVVAVVAWRLGEARLRDAALEAANRLPPSLSLSALALSDLPEPSAPLVLAGLRHQGWCQPRELWSEPTLRALAAGSVSSAALAERLARLPRAPLSSFCLLAKVGEFSGFGGHFSCPPLVLDGGQPHSFFARAPEQDFRLDADVFGWTCTPQPKLDLPLRAVSAPSERRKGVGRLTAPTDSARLLPDGTLTLAGETARLVALAGATSYVALPGVVLTAHADSHRIRVVGAKRGPL